MREIKISASILSSDFSNLRCEIESLENSGVDMLHIDVMDGHFVPNLTVGPCVIKSLRAHSYLQFDVHLMVDRPETLLQDYASAGADFITIHQESTLHLDRVLGAIKSLGCKAGIALLPSTSPDVIDYILDQLDLILVMTVNPGFGGQVFIESQLEKIKIIADKIKKSGKNILISVDGGINEKTAKQSRDAGADILVSGNFIFKSEDYTRQVNMLKSCGGCDGNY